MPRMTTLGHCASISFVILCAAACGPRDISLHELRQPLPPLVTSATGCWAFVHPAQVIRDRMSDSSLLRLDTAFRGGSTQSLDLSVLPVTPEQQRLTKVSGWGVDARDTTRIRIWLGDGFTGVEILLRQRGDSLMGSGRGYTDVTAPWFLPHAVAAHRVACPR